MFLYLRTELLIGADEKPQQMSQELSDWAVLQVLTARVLQSSGNSASAGVATSGRGRGFFLETNSTQRHEEAIVKSLKTVPVDVCHLKRVSKLKLVQPGGR